MSLTYQEYPAPAELDDAIQTMWTMTYTGASPHKYLIVPSGCAELIVNVGVPSVQHVADEQRRQHVISYLAEYERYFHVELMPGTAMIGARILPTAVRGFVYPELFSHETYGAYCLQPGLVTAIMERVVAAAAQRATFEQALARHIRKDRFDPKLRKVVRAVYERGAAGSLDAEQSRRQAERNFHHQVGI